MHGRHLTLSNREVLAQRHARGGHPADIAQELGCHIRTVYREFQRNASEGHYYPARAQALADQRRRGRKRRSSAPSLPSRRQQRPTFGVLLLARAIT